LKIAVESFGYMGDSLVLFLMTGGFILIVLSNFATVKMYSFMPLIVYLMYPGFSIVCPVFGTIAMAQAISSYENTRAIKGNWNYEHVLSSNVRKYWRKKVNSLNPIKIQGVLNGFHCYFLKQSTIPNYWYRLVDYSIGAIISIPDSLLS
jgi:hypothetical protein